MHIEPGIVDGAKIVLSYATAAVSLGLAAKAAVASVREVGIAPFLVRSAITTALVFSFFEVLPHQPVGVSEVHLILGSTLFLLFGTAAAACGLALGLLMQGLFFEPLDLPQYGMNVTTLLIPLFAISALSQRIIPASTAYVDVKYSQALALSTAFQGGIVLWVAFWALYGQGVSVENVAHVASFGAAYMSVIVLEPLIDLAVLAGAKSLRSMTSGSLFVPRLHLPA